MFSPQSHVSRWLLAGGLVSMLSCLAATVFASPPCPPEQIPVDLGNLPLTFGSAGDHYEGHGLGSTLVIDGSGLTIHSHRAVASPSTHQVRFIGGHFEPQGALQSEPITRFKKARVSVAEYQAGWGSVEAEELYPGVDLAVTATQRRLWLTFDAQSAAQAMAIRLQIPGAAAEAVSKRRLRFANDFSEIGTPFELELIALELSDSGDRKIDATWQVREGQLSIRFAQIPTGPVRLVVTSMLASYQEPIAVSRLNDESLVAVTPGRSAEQPQRELAVLHRLDASGTQLKWTGLVELIGHLKVRDLALAPTGELMLVGQKVSGSSSSAYLSILDMEWRTLRESSVLDGIGDRVDAVITEPSGTVAVIGTSPRQLRAQPGGLSFKVTLPSVPDSDDATSRRFVARIDPGNNRLLATAELMAPARFDQLEAWIDCWGQLHFGTPWSPSPPSVQYTYSVPMASSSMQSCQRIEEGHGFGALCWKAQQNAADWTYHPWNLDEVDVPSVLVTLEDPTDPNPGGLVDYVRLNELENNQFGNVFYDTANGQWGDPSGSWGHYQNWAYSKVELAIAAAIYQERWVSPTFANLRVPTDVQPPAVRAVMLRAETFSAPNAGQLPHTLCTEDSDGDGVSDFGQTAWPTPFEFQVASACSAAHGSSFTLDSLTYDTWRPGDAYIPDQVLAGSDLSWWPYFSVYVGDPPVLHESEPGLSAVHVQEMSRRLLSSARLEASLTTTEYSNGVAINVTSELGQVPARSFD